MSISTAQNTQENLIFIWKNRLLKTPDLSKSLPGSSVLKEQIRVGAETLKHAVVLVSS